MKISAYGCPGAHPHEPPRCGSRPDFFAEPIASTNYNMPKPYFRPKRIGRTMLAHFKEHIRDLAAEYPFAVVLRGMDEPVILIPAAASRSNYEDVRIKEPDRIRQMLSAATSDGTLLPALRRMTETAMPCSSPTRLNDK